MNNINTLTILKAVSNIWRSHNSSNCFQGIQNTNWNFMSIHWTNYHTK